MSCDVGKRQKGWRISCDVGELMERLENELCMGGSPGELSEELVT